MRTPDDAEQLRTYLTAKQARRAVVVGGGFIGLEIAENLLMRGLSVTVVDIAPQVMPNVLDPEMANFAKKHLQKCRRPGTYRNKSDRNSGRRQQSYRRTDRAGKIVADVVVMSVGIRPNTAWLSDSGIQMERGVDRGR